jgi:hypothetical protein
MYQYRDRLTQLLTKYKYIWLWLRCFDPYLGHRQGYIINLVGVVQNLNMYYTIQAKHSTAATPRRGHIHTIIFHQIAETVCNVEGQLHSLMMASNMGKNMLE